MIKATVLTRHGYEQSLHFEEMDNYKRWRLHWETHPNSLRLVHDWERSIRLCDITKVISVEDSRVIKKGRN